MSTFEWKPGLGTKIQADGKSLEAVCYGPAPKDAPTIIMLHEGLGSVSLWKEFPERLAEATGFGVFVYSRAGYGKSDPAELPRPIDYMSHEAKVVLPQVLDAIGFENGILLGHSDGASIAAIHAGSLVDFRVRGLVLMAPHFFTEPEGLASIVAANEAYERGDLREKLARYHDDVDNAFRGWNDAWLNPDFAEWNVAEAIDYLRIPVLAIQGVDDQYGTEAQIRELTDRAYSPVDVCMLEDCKHSPHHEQPDAVLAAVKDFAERLYRLERAEVKVA